MGLFGTTHPRAVHSAWVFLIFGWGHTCIGESLTTALVEVKFNFIFFFTLTKEILRLQFLSNYLNNFFFF